MREVGYKIVRKANRDVQLVDRLDRPETLDMKHDLFSTFLK